MILQPPADPLVFRAYPSALKAISFRRLTNAFYSGVTPRMRGVRLQIQALNTGFKPQASRFADRLLGEITKGPCFIVALGATWGLSWVFAGRSASAPRRVLTCKPIPEMSQAAHSAANLGDQITDAGYPVAGTKACKSITILKRVHDVPEIYRIPFKRRDVCAYTDTQVNRPTMTTNMPHPKWT